MVSHYRAVVVAANGGGRVRGLRDAAPRAVMSDGLLTASAAVAFNVEDIEHSDDGSGTLICTDPRQTRPARKPRRCTSERSPRPR